MEFSRRHLLKLSLLAALPSPPASATGEPTKIERRTGPSVLQGATDETRTQFSVVHSEDQALGFHALDANGALIPPDRFATCSEPGQATVISRLFFSGLRLGETYRLQIFDPSTQTVIDERTFRTLETNKAVPRFAICSCMDDSRHTPEIWRDLIQREPDFILFIGDSVYCDHNGDTPVDDAGPGRLWRRFAEARATLEIYFSERLIPIFAVWDDHDFGRNDGGRDFPYVKESQDNFMRFFAMDPEYCSVLERGPGVSSRLRIGRQQFLLMDDRSWRAPKGSRERYAHWGEDQENWLFENVDAHSGVNWIINGSQMFPQMPFKESFSGGHPVQFEAFKKRLARSGGRAVLISGDVHFSEISRIESRAFGYPTYELTSSSMHSRHFPGAPYIIPNPRRIASTPNKNYLLVESEAKGAGCAFSVQSRSANGILNFAMRLTV